MSDEHSKQGKKYIYIPPSAETIEDYAHKVCKQMGKEFSAPEIMYGFSGFLKIIITILAAHLNNQKP